MISNNKKYFAQHLLKLALALSLLRAHPDTYLDWNLESRQNSRGTVGILELRAAPLTDHPYANRKAVMPFIEDLARFNPAPFDVQAYLFTHSSTFPASESQQETNQNASSTIVEDVHAPTEEIFLNSEVFNEPTSILDQNLADLHDFGEDVSHHMNLYETLKEEPPQEPVMFDLFKCERADAECDNDAAFGSLTAPSPDDDEGGGYGGIVQWDEYFGVKHDIDESFLATREDAGSVAAETEIEFEIQLNSTDPEFSDASVPTTPLTSNDTEDDDDDQEELDLIKILAAQDIDMGYLPPEVDEIEKIKKEQEEKDAAEKLKILQEINSEKKSYQDEDDEEESLPYTVDRETGEKILLSSISAADTFLDPVFEDVGEFSDTFSDLLSEESPLVPNSPAVAAVSPLPTQTRAGRAASVLSFDENLDEFDIGPLDFDALLLDTEQTTTDPTATTPLLSPLSSSSSFAAESSDNDSEAVLDFDDKDLDMYITQSASGYTNTHHSRQGPPSASLQNYATGHHGVNGLRQGGYLPHHPQSRVPLSRISSMDQRFEFPMFTAFTPSMGMGMDMAPNHPAHYSPHFPYHHQAAAASQQFGTSMLHHHHHHQAAANSTLDHLGLSPHPQASHYPPNLGTAVASSMNLTNLENEGAAGGAYKMEHDNFYYSNTSSDMTHADDIFTPILNDDGLQQQMDMLSDDMCPMINGVPTGASTAGGPGATSHGGASGILQGGNALQTSLTSVGGASGGGTVTGNGDRLDASSDSAVSSMGSERVPSLSDGEWNDGSDSAQEYNNPYDYSYSNRDGVRGPVAQKKHQMFGKRIFNDGQQTNPTSGATGTTADHLPATIKYEYDAYGIGSGMEGAVGGSSIKQPPTAYIHADLKYPSPYGIGFDRVPLRPNHLDHVAHNHSYPLPQTQGIIARPQTRDKKTKKGDEEHLTRDEKRARQLSIPIGVQEIINLPMDEFNERLSKFDLTESQLSLIRDIRRRGKNKVAAQNCRKRKLDQIHSLAEEVHEMRSRKDRLNREREMAVKDHAKVSEKYKALYRHVQNHLRDADGNLYSPDHYTLQLSAEGVVVVLPRTMENSSAQDSSVSHHHHQHQSSTRTQQGSSTGTRSSHPHSQHPQQSASSQQQQQQQHHSHYPQHHPHHHPHQPQKE